MATMSFTWTLPGSGWAQCRIADSQGHAEVGCSYISESPEEFLSAVARLVLGATEQRVLFRDEPEVYRWMFRQHQGEVTIRLRWAREENSPEETATLIWTTRQPADTLARVIIRAFDQVKQEHDEHNYLKQWGRPFPHHELEALRTAWRTTHHKTNNIK